MMTMIIFLKKTSMKTMQMRLEKNMLEEVSWMLLMELLNLISLVVMN